MERFTTPVITASIVLLCLFLIDIFTSFSFHPIASLLISYIIFEFVFMSRLLLVDLKGRAYVTAKSVLGWPFRLRSASILIGMIGIAMLF
ncbi:hypothetical protein HNQ41_002218 [Texcoconibacillus texcoconensis]|uniref:Uncharacterized protein n=1 Tax=Texcoconibacillus texcoconensis TaxID=1095777 RepID=A0A840QRS1_9BACI|nr:hypothetical protein [Texcoconibacillus texcoconensis]